MTGERPSARVLDLFAVPDVVTPLPGAPEGPGVSVVAGDLLLTPGRDAGTLGWLAPLVARLAIALDTRPGRGRRDLRIAVPVPARDGSLVVEGWAASRYEPGSVACRDLGVTLAAGRLLHAELASWVPERPEALEPVPVELPGRAPQLVHAELAGRVLLDPWGAPVVTDVTPAWAPPQWAEALCVLDAVAVGDAPPSVLEEWGSAPERELLASARSLRPR